MNKIFLDGKPTKIFLPYFDFQQKGNVIPIKKSFRNNFEAQFGKSAALYSFLLC